MQAVSLLGGGAGVVAGGFGLLVLAVGLGLWLAMRRLQATPECARGRPRTDGAEGPHGTGQARPPSPGHAAVERRRTRDRVVGMDRGAASVPAALPSRLPPLQPGAAPSPVQAEISAHLRRLAQARAARLQPGRRALAASAADATTPRGSLDLTLDGPPEPPGGAWSIVTLTDEVPLARAPARAPAPAPQPAAPMPARLSVIESAMASALAPLAAPERSEPPQACPPPSVLVADDARIVRVKLARLLGPRGWTVHEAADGDTAIAQLRASRPTLLVTDVDMPGLDGFALTRAIRAEPGLADLPVIMVTGDDDRHRDEAARAGVSVLLGKPYGEAALLAHIRRLCPGAAAAASAAEARADTPVARAAFPGPLHAADPLLPVAPERARPALSLGQ